MRFLVAGSAGFIGSTIAETLLQAGHDVLGIDCFLDSYPRAVKEHRARRLAEYDNLDFVQGDLVELDLASLLRDVDVVFHEAAQAGMLASWGATFDRYTRNNILATQKLLEAAREVGLKRFVYASSSSVYGESASREPIKEELPTKPLSPYGVSKLAGEHLCRLYCRNFGVPTVCLRYFTVFGPRPRPDMSFCIFSRAMLTGEPITVFGDGEQSRGFTYVGDAVRATIAAGERDCVGETMNIGGGTNVTINQVIRAIEAITGKKAEVKYESALTGDIKHTMADTTKARQVIGYKPQTDFESGLAALIESVKDFYRL